MLKMLLYCTQQKPFLINDCGKFYLDNKTYNHHWKKGMIAPEHLNGKIVGECDFEVEKIYQEFENKTDRTGLFWYQTNNLTEKELLKQSGLTMAELSEYLEPLEQKYIYGKGWQIKPNGYAIHIKNLVIYDEPKELSEYDKYEYEIFSGNGGCLGTEWKPIEKAPQNMMYVYDNGEKKILISIRSKWMCLIANRIKDIEVRKVVLKEMV